MKNQTSDKDKLLPLTLKRYADERKLPADYLATVWGLKDVTHDDVDCIQQPYTRMDGTVCAPRYRYEKKSPMNCGDRIVLYGQKQLANLKPDPPDIFLVEGESDTQTLHCAGYPVLGIPGTSMWETCIKNDPAILKFLAARRHVFLIQEPPSASEKKKRLNSPAKMLAKIRESLPGVKVQPIRLWEQAPLNRHGEPSYKDVSGAWMYFGGHLPASVLFGALDATIEKDKPSTWEIESVLASEVPFELTEWFWLNKIPQRNVTVFAGMPGKGKSTCARDVVARLTTGRDMPDSPKQVEACECAIFATEDSVAETIAPSLEAARADLTKVHIGLRSKIVGQENVGRSITLDTDLPLLKKWLEQFPAVKFLVFDPATSYIGIVDPNKPRDVRPFLDKLKVFAEEMDITILLIMHLSKNPDVSAMHRVGGAATWIESPRASWFFDLEKQDEENPKPPSYVMVNGKLNMVADSEKKSLKYNFGTVIVKIQERHAPFDHKDTKKGVIEWGDVSEVTLDQQYGKQSTGKPRGPVPKKKDQAKAWLRLFLADGQHRKTEVDAAVAKLGEFSVATLEDASREIGVCKFEHEDAFWWKLPAEKKDGVEGFY